MFRLRKYIAIFLLLGFLSPFITEGIHSFVHQDDFHCLSSDTHLHKQEHHCALCDFTPPFSDAVVSHHENFLFEVDKLTQFSFYENSFVGLDYPNISPRAPPVLS